MGPIVTFVILALVTVSLTRLVVRDELPLVRVPREWLIRGLTVIDGDGNIQRDPKRWGRLAGLAYSIAYLWTCPWCMSVWVGLAVWGVADWRLSVPLPWAMIFVARLCAGILAMVEGEHEQRYKLRDRDLKTRRFREEG